MSTASAKAQTAAQATARVTQRPLPVRRRIPFINSRFGTDKPRLLDLARLCERWERMEAAGIPVKETIKMLADNFERTSYAISTALDKVLYDVENGSSLGEAFPEHTKVFGENFVTCITIGEESGTLELQLGRMKKYFETEHRTNQSLKSLIWYPLILTAVAAFTIYVIVFKVIPQFAELMRAFDKFELPWPTRFVIWVSEVATSWVGWACLIGLALLAVSAVITYKSSEGVRYWVAQHALKLPIFGGLILYRNLAAAFYAMSIMLKATGRGPYSMERGAAACSNVFLRDKITTAANASKEGLAMCDTLIDTKVMPPEAEIMLRVAEKTGEYDEQLEKLADSFISEVEYYRQTILEVIKPVTIIFFGGLCGIVVIAFYWPMFALFQHIR